MPKRRAASALATVLVLGGCGHHSGAAFSERRLPSLVLQQRDVPAAFSSFDFGPQVRADSQPGPRLDPKRFGREGGWIARYKRSGTRATRGPLVIESRVDVFNSNAGANRDLKAYAQQFARDVGTGAVSVKDLGAGSVGTTFTQGRLRLYVLAWRHANATASVLAEGFDGKLSLADVVALARKQESHFR